MTKSSFIALADMIREHDKRVANHDNPCAVRYMDPDVPAFHPAQIEALASFCASQNPNFNRERWLDYIAGKCGKNGGKVSPSR